MELSMTAVNEYFADGGGDQVVTEFEVLETHSETEVNVRVSFGDDTVSDWKLTLDEDGTVLDGYCYNDVM